MTKFENLVIAAKTEFESASESRRNEIKAEFGNWFGNAETEAREVVAAEIKGGSESAAEIVNSYNRAVDIINEFNGAVAALPADGEMALTPDEMGRFLGSMPKFEL